MSNQGIEVRHGRHFIYGYSGCLALNLGISRTPSCRTGVRHGITGSCLAVIPWLWLSPGH